MRRPAIIMAAALCGAGAFVWALARAPAAGWEVRAGGRRPGMLATWPHEIAALKQFVVDHPRSLGAWDELARRQKGSGDLEGSKETWKAISRIAFEEAGRRTEDPLTSFILGWACTESGDPATAEIAFRRAARLYESQTGHTWFDALPMRNLGWCRRRLGDEAGAAAAWKDALASIDGPTLDGMTGGTLYNLACFRALTGDREGALAAFEQAITAGWLDGVWAQQDEDLDSLRDDERFKAAMDRMKNPQGPPGVLTGG